MKSFLISSKQWPVAQPAAATKSRRQSPKLSAIPWAMLFLLVPGLAQADERAELEQLKATTMAMLKALVESGLLPKEKAEDIVRQAQQQGQQAAAAQTPLDQKAAPGSALAAVPNATPNANPNAATQLATGKPASPSSTVIRVPYVSDKTKAEISAQVKEEVLAQAKQEGWGNVQWIPEWVKRIELEGDIRVRWQSNLFDSSNIPANDPYQGVYATQNTPFSDTPAWAPDVFNTTHDQNTTLYRARLGFLANLGQGFKTGVRIATGNNSSAISTNQLMGNYFNKGQLWIDRAYIQWAPRQDMTWHIGRFTNKVFYATDLTWPADFNFDGISMNYQRPVSSRSGVFSTLGIFPVENMRLSAKNKWLYGAQIGTTYQSNEDTTWKVGLAYYDFKRIEGYYDGRDPPAPNTLEATPYLQSQYPKGVRTKGNSLIRINTPYFFNNGNLEYPYPVWGLASRFHPINLTLAATFNQFAPYTIYATLDYIKNTGFNLGDIRRRADLPDLDLAKKTTAWQLRFDVGPTQIERLGQWNLFVAWRHLERDAWVDAFTDTAWGLAGTNYQGWSIGGQYGIGPNVYLGMRWTSTRNLSDGRVVKDPISKQSHRDISSQPFKLDIFQFDINARF